MEASSSHPQQEQDRITEKTRNILWEDVADQLSFNEDKVALVTETPPLSRLVSQHFYKKQILHSIIHVWWHFVKELKIEEVRPNWYLFTFSSKEKKEKVLQMSPWNFKGSFMILNEWAPGTNWENSYGTCWILGYRSMAYH